MSNRLEGSIVIDAKASSLPSPSVHKLLILTSHLLCSLSGRPLSPENVVFFVGDFLDPDEADSQDLVEKISYAIDEVFAARSAGPDGVVLPN